MKKCEICGKEYIKNENILDCLPESIKEKIKYIPSCDCYLKEQQKQFQKQIEEDRRESIANKVKKYKSISVIDKKFKKSTFEVAEDNKHIQIAKKFCEVAKKRIPKAGIAFMGTVGTGKTFAAACISNNLMNNGRTVLAINLGLYLNKLKTEWGQAEQDFLKQVESCDFLIIDDFGSENATEWATEKIFNLIDARYRSEKPLIISSNLNVSDEKDMLNHFKFDINCRIYDRLKAITYPIVVTGKSYRRTPEDEFARIMRGE